MYGFPKDTERRAKWLTKTSRSNLPVTKDYNNTKICEVIIFKCCICTFSQTPLGSLNVCFIKNIERLTKYVCE